MAHMLMTTRALIKKGPNTWGLQLGLFDPEPSPLSDDELQLHNRRVTVFYLMSGSLSEVCLRTRVVGVSRPRAGDELWVISVLNDGTDVHQLPTVCGLPSLAGAQPFDVHYDPVKRTGWVELPILSPCHLAPVSIVAERPADHVSQADRNLCTVCGAEIVSIDAHPGGYRRVGLANSTSMTLLLREWRG